MSGHTPGPWRLLPRIEPYVKHPIVQRGDSGGFFVQDEDAERGDADARLIAAAPDLADALLNLLVALGKHTADMTPAQLADICPACDAASAALIASGRVMG